MRVRECRHGVFMTPAQDVYVGKALDLYGEYSEMEVQFLLSLIEPGDVVVEVGSHIGAITVPMASRARLVLAYEAQRITHQILCGNIALNGLKNVYAFWSAIGSEPGQIAIRPAMWDKTDNYGAYEARAVEGGEIVGVRTLDSFNLAACDLLKVDAEGSEAEVLRGAERLIADCKPLLYIENDRPEKHAELMGLLANYGYRAWWHFTPLFNEANVFGKQANIYGNTISINMVCSHRDEPWADSLPAAEPDKNFRQVLEEVRV